MKNNHYLATLIIYTTAIVLLMMVHISASVGCFSGLSDKSAEVVGSVLPQIVIMFAIPLVLLILVRKKSKEPITLGQVCNNIGWNKISFKNVCLCFVLGICLYILNIFIASLFATLLRSFGYQFSSSDNAFTGYDGLVISIILSAVLPGICEEFLHRGILLNGMMHQMGVKKAILWSSLLFGLMHMNVGQFFYATILGWFMAVTVLSSGSLWGSIIVHFTNNALATYMSFAEDLKLPGANLFSYLFSNGLTLIITSVVVFVVIGEIMRHMARDKFNRNLDRYTVRYLAAEKQFTTDHFEKVKEVLPRIIQGLPTWKATAAYIETFEQPKQARPLEKAFLVAVCFMGVTLTVLSFVWGTW
ncbi:MAG: CPBP family intramembrane metalloprotease [Clostridia bacterium]|nr:CPBP family intramembrane metalloprotease [Clostridia bacterium]